MNKKRTIISLFIISFLIAFHPALAEKISLKLSYNTSSISGSDLNTWLESLNSIWNDWQKAKGGQVEGHFELFSYGPKYEVELRIPISWGIALNLSGNYFNSAKEGNIAYQSDTGKQSESRFIRNEISAIPLKIGLSYSYPVPIIENLYVFANVGRHIIFVQYKTTEDWEAFFKSFGEEFHYWYKKDNTFRSEALGFYASLGVEYDLIKYIAVVVEAEKIWSRVDGFKGPHSFKGVHPGFGDPKNGFIFEESGKASLYFYEENPYWTEKYYPALSGHKKRPDKEEFRNLRQGEFSFSDFSFKIGIRFKF